VITAPRERRVGTDAGGQGFAAARRWRFDPRIVAPILAATLYLVVMALRLSGTLSTFYSYSDFPEALRLGDAVFHGGWGYGLAVPSQSGIGPLWVVGLLNQLTGSETAGMLVGAFMVAVAAGFMIWTAHRVLGRVSAIVIGALCVGAPPVVAWEMLTPIAHESTLLLTAVFAWQLVALARGQGGHAIPASLAVGVLAGVCLASDLLALVAAVIPWIICALILVRRHRERRLALLVTAGAAVASMVAIDLLSRANGFVERGSVAAPPSLNGITSGLRTTSTTLAQMISGTWYGDVLPLLAVVAFAGFAAMLYLASRHVRIGDGGATPGRQIYVWFWSLSAGGLIAALCLSGLGIQYSPINYQGHYVDGLWFAIAALLPVALMRRNLLSRTAVLGMSCLVLVSALGIITMPSRLLEKPDYQDATQLTATLRQLGVDHGYGGYWESYSIGWDTNQRIAALPLQRCTRGSVRTLCHYEFASPAWYRTQPGPVFLIILRGSGTCFNDDACLDARSLADLPPPEVTRIVGLLQVNVYARDVFAGLPTATAP
jgi:hypothetical protein